jgi:two-component system, OmpR family, osmolarity sensor histidine kinase EnvZ
MSKRNPKQRSIFHYALLRIVSAILLFELMVGGLAFFLLMLPVLENHALNFAEQLVTPQSASIRNYRLESRPPADGGASWLPFNQLLARKLQHLTGHPSEVRKIAGQADNYWLPLQNGYAIFNQRTVVGAMPLHALAAWFSLALLAALAIATWLARGLTQPITQLRNNLKQHSDITPLAETPKVGINELDELSQEFAQLTSSLALAIDDRTTLLLGLSHELSAPVARLTMAFELYAKQIENSKRVDMQGDLDEMRRIIEQFLSSARCLSAQEQQQYSLPHLMRWLEQRYADKPNVHIEIPLQETDYALNATALERILSNLINNALRHAAASNISVTITQHPDRLEFTVADNGPGIPVADIPRLFHPFEKHRASQGTGLGLALSRLMAEQNGWTLTLENRSTGGLQARVLIPVLAAEK